MTTVRTRRAHEHFLTPAARRIAAWIALITVAACTLTTEAIPTADVVSVSVTPPTTTVSVGSQVPLQALVQDAAGKQVTGTTVYWSVENPAIATISSTGVVTGMSIGSTEVSASANGKSGIATITVQKAPVASVVVTPPHVDAAPGDHVPLTAVAYDATQDALTDRTITWSTSNAGVATVDETGMLIAVGQGTATITATSEGKTGTATVTVVQAPVATVSVTPTPLSMSVGQSTQLTVILKDAGGNVLTGPAVTWSSSNTAVATVSPSGLVTAVTAGTTTITATCEGITGSAAVTASNVAVGSVAVSPQNASIVARSTLQLTTTVLDVNGAVVTGRVVTWTSSNTSEAAVGTSGLVTGVSPGTVTITATSEGKTGTTAVTVTPVPVGSVTLAPTTSNIRITETVGLTPTVKDTGGVVVFNRVVTWSSSNTAVATVSSSGVVTGLSTGTATITATSETKSGTAAVNVSPIPVGTVTLSPATKSMLVTQTFGLTPTVKDSVGNVVTDRVVTWSSSNTAVATVSSTGVVTAVAPGTATITATSETKTGTSTITVSLVPVSSVAVQPSPASITLTASAQFAAVTKDSIGGLLTGRTITWASSDPTTVSISSTGLATALKLGTATITATSEGKNGTSLVTVTKIPVGSVTVSPASKALLVSQTVALTATVRDSTGTVVTDRPVGWSSSNTGVATVSSAGLVTAVAPGTATITATSETKSGTSTITVSPVPVGIVVVQPAHDTLTVGTSGQLTVVTEDSVGGVLTGRVVTWASSDPATISVNGTGLITALKPGGPITITATSEGKSGTSAVVALPVPVASVTITPTTATILSGGTTTFTAVTKDAQGNVLTGRVVTWNSTNTAAATVNSAGVATGVAGLSTSAATTITATSEGVTSNGATLTVNPVPVASVAVTPTTVTILSGATTSFTAVTKDAQGNVLTGRVVTWNSTNTAAAAVNGTGVATSVAGLSASASTTITATSEGVISNGATLTVNPAPVATVAITPTTATILSGATATFTAVPKDAQGNVLTGRTIAWSSTNTAAATVNAAGVATGVAGLSASASTTITATSEGVTSNSATLTVNPAPVASVAITPTTATILSGATTTFTAVLKDAHGNVLTGRTIAWNSTNAAAATVNASGVATGAPNLSVAGTTTITATSEGVISNGATLTVNPVPVASVTVSPASVTIFSGATTTFTAVLKDAQGNILTGRVVTWNSTNAAAATVNASGVATGVPNLSAAGTTTITATSEGVTSNGATLTVNPAPVATVAVTPTTVTILSGATTTFAAVTKDAQGNVLTGRVVTWNSTNTAAATVNSSGVATGAANLSAAGTTTITATSEGVTSNGATLTVNPVPVASVAVSPSSATILSGTTTTFTAVTKDAQGNVLTGRVVTWNSTNTAAATVNGAGVATGVAGLSASASTTITATSEGVTSNGATLTVNPVPVASVTISPPSPDTVFIGYTTQLGATTKDSTGGTLTGRVVTWQSDNTAAATVSATGLVTGVAAGSANITATSEGKTASVSMVSIAAPVGSVVVAPASDSVTTGGVTAQLTATVRDVKGTVVTDRTISWSSAQPSLASVSPSSGPTVTVTGVSAGPASIVATVETKTGSSSVKVIPAVAAVQISPPTATLSLATSPTVQLSATCLDASSSPVTGRTIHWSTSDATVATVDANGLVTAKGAGTASITATAVLDGVTSSVATVVTVTP